MGWKPIETREFNEWYSLLYDGNDVYLVNFRTIKGIWIGIYCMDYSIKEIEIKPMWWHPIPIPKL